MMRILFIYFQNVLESWKTSLNGTLQRQQMHLDALKEIAHLDILSYVPTNTDISAEAIQQGEQKLHQKLDAKNINLFFCHRNETPEQWPAWKRYGYGIFSFFYQNLYWGVSGPEQVKALEACLKRKPDVIFVQRLTAMPPLLLTQESLPPIIFDLDDIEHIRFLRQLRNSKSAFSLLHVLQLPARFWGEWKAIHLAQRTFVCSEADNQYLGKLIRAQGITTISNAVYIPPMQPITRDLCLLFLGTYSSAANVEAANFLIEQVWPLIYQEMPLVKLILAGNNPQNIRGYKKNTPGIHFTGFVEDLDVLYAQSRVVCCPIFTGAGTRVKMVEAAAYGKPIVATQLGVEGLNLTNGEDYLEGNTVQTFATACLKLLQDHSLCNQIGISARAKAIQFYDREKIIKDIQEQVRQVTMV
jgi:glycosyltransferase involved in cell wall biosynthesis